MYLAPSSFHNPPIQEGGKKVEQFIWTLPGLYINCCTYTDTNGRLMSSTLIHSRFYRHWQSKLEKRGGDGRRRELETSPTALLKNKKRREALWTRSSNGQQLANDWVVDMTLSLCVCDVHCVLLAKENSIQGIEGAAQPLCVYVGKFGSIQ